LTNKSVPDETQFRSEIGLFIHSPTDDAITETLLPHMYNFESNTTKMYDGTLKRMQQHYLRKGNWHQYMLAPSVWQETSFSILHTKGGLASLKRFLIHNLARTLPTYHRLNLVRAKLFTNKSCFLCGAVDESIEHIFYECPHFVTERSYIQQQTVNLCLTGIRESQSSKVVHAAKSISEITIQSLIFPTLTDTEQYRTFSAGQLSKAFQTWLLSIVKCPRAAMKIGSAIHLHLVSSYQSIWKSRCSMNKVSGLDFKSRLASSPRGVSLDELSKNNYVIYANHETIARAKSKKKVKNKKTKISRLSASNSKSTNKTCQATASSNTKKRKGSKLANDIIHSSAQKPAKLARCKILTDKSNTPLPVAQSTPSTTPITDRSQAKTKMVEQFDSSSWFVPDDRHFTSAFAIQDIAMDGNCLFRAILSACGIDDEQHHEYLRAICVKEVIADWDNLSTYANFIHRVHRDNNIWEPGG
jgi:hypothetical protein